MKKFKKNISNADIRYEMTPQMAEYDKIGTRWLPYLMYFHTPNYISSVLNTDEHGFRVSYAGDSIIRDFDTGDRKQVSLLVGGSFAFGVGATSDGKTICSKLNEITNGTWLNFGGRTYSSTQELLLFLLYYHNLKDIEQVIVLSGLNNLTLSYMSKRFTAEIGSFFFSNMFDNRMNAPESPGSVKNMLKSIIKQVIPDKKENKAFSQIESETAAREDAISVLKRDIRIWKLLCSALNIEFSYVLQPVATWIDRKKSPEEERLFRDLDARKTNNWRILNEKLNCDTYKWYAKEVGSICASNGMAFFDMNKAISRNGSDNKWLFVDRAHCTDQGYRVVAEVLKKDVIR